MRGGRVAKLIGLGVLAGAAAAAVKALRGDDAPQFSTHPTVTGGPAAGGGPTPLRLDPEPLPNPGPAPTVTQVVVPPADAPADSPAPAAPAGTDGATTWVEPVDGTCPDGFPIKAKLSSGIFHQPGGLAYDRTKPDRCYPSADAAEADGLRAAKR